MKPYWLLLFLFPFAISCTDSPENDPGAKSVPVVPPAQLVDGSIMPKSADLLVYSSELFSFPGEIDGVGSAEYDAKKEKNLSAPIIYGIGAANITMDTTFNESKDLLTPPFRGPFADGGALYNEQVYVIWQNEGERKPRLIIPIKGYLGKMEAGKFGQLDFQSKFPEYKQGGDIQAGAQKLIRELYLELEQLDDPSYDCLATGRCTLIVGDTNQPNMVFVFPGAVFLMAKEEFQLAEVRIVRDIDPGLLANNLDMLSGDIMVPNQEPIPLGSYYHEVFGRLEESGVKSNPDIYVSTDSFGYSWRGFWYSFNRTNFDINAVEAEFTDVTEAVQTSSQFPAYFTVGQDRILVNQTPESVSFSLETSIDPETVDMDDVFLSPTEMQSKLKMTTVVAKDNAKMFVTGLSKLLKTELKKDYDTVVSRIGGFQDEARVNKEIYASLQAFNSENLSGKLISFKVSQEQQKLDYVVVKSIDSKLHPFNKIVLPTLKNNVVRKMVPQIVIHEVTNEPIPIPGTNNFVTAEVKAKTFTELNGFKLNDLIRLTEVDALGRGEATAELLSAAKDLGVIKERVNYIEQSTLEVPDEKRLVKRNQGAIVLPATGTVLGIKIVGTDNVGPVARVVSIGSGDVFGTFGDVCGLGESLKWKIEIPVDKAESALLRAIAKKQKVDPDFQCNYIPGRDEGGKNFLKKLYFPDENLFVTFDGKALSSVNIYLPMNQVQAMPEVSND